MAEAFFKGCKCSSSPTPKSNHLLMPEQSAIPIIFCCYRLLAVSGYWQQRGSTVNRSSPSCGHQGYIQLWDQWVWPIHQVSTAAWGIPMLAGGACRRPPVTVGWGSSGCAVGPASGRGCQAVPLQVWIIPVCCILFSSNELLKADGWGNRYFKQYREKKLLADRKKKKKVQIFICSPHASGSLSVIYHLCAVIQRGLQGSQDTYFVQPEQFLNEGDHLSACPGTARLHKWRENLWFCFVKRILFPWLLWPAPPLIC